MFRSSRIVVVGVMSSLLAVGAPALAQSAATEAELQAHRYREAAQHLQVELSSFPANGDPEAKKRLESSFYEAKKHVGAIDVHVGAEGAAITLDGADAGTSPIHGSLFCDPGRHTLRAELGGASAVESANCVAGTIVTIDLALAPASKRKVGVVVAGAVIAGAALAAGGVFAILASGKANDAATTRDALVAGGGPAACSSPANAVACSDLESSGNAKATFSNMALSCLIGGGVIGIGTIAYVIGTSSSSRPEKANARARPELFVGPRSVTLRGTF